MVQHATPATPIWFVYARLTNKFRLVFYFCQVMAPAFFMVALPPNPGKGETPLYPLQRWWLVTSPQGDWPAIIPGGHVKRQAVVFAIANLHRQAWPLDVVAATTLSFF